MQEGVEATLAAWQAGKMFESVSLGRHYKEEEAGLEGGIEVVEVGRMLVAEGAVVGINGRVVKTTRWDSLGLLWLEVEEGGGETKT
mmetsp:Transcript_18880/g.24338  ORF Transcript_18880/g.24338 Transcript_18880/m.24338 type:complete len:86 (+) Transcript_18880:662-919(+)